MVRPRASESNLSAAVAFGKAITICLDANDWTADMATIPCSGPESIFAVLCECLPHLVRDAYDKKPNNRKGVTEIELNKAIQVGTLVLRFEFAFVPFTITGFISPGCRVHDIQKAGSYPKFKNKTNGLMHVSNSHCHPMVDSLKRSPKLFCSSFHAADGQTQPTQPTSRPFHLDCKAPSSRIPSCADAASPVYGRFHCTHADMYLLMHPPSVCASRCAVPLRAP